MPRNIHADRGLTILPGARVLDTQTGETGIVESGDVKHTPPSQSFRVKLDSGAAVDRSAADLFELPAGLNVPLSDLHQGS